MIMKFPIKLGMLMPASSFLNINIADIEEKYLKLIHNHSQTHVIIFPLKPFLSFPYGF